MSTRLYGFISSANSGAQSIMVHFTAYPPCLGAWGLVRISEGPIESMATSENAVKWIIMDSESVEEMKPCDMCPYSPDPFDCHP